MVYRYYETEAARVAGCTPKEMFSKRKPEESVLARQLAMYFMKQTTSLSLANIGLRFNKDHSTVLAAIRVVNDRCETEKDFKEMFDHYMDVCLKEKDRLYESEKGIDIIREHGLTAFLNEQNEIFVRYMHVCNQFVKGDATDDEVLLAIEEIEVAISKVKFNFTK